MQQYRRQQHLQITAFLRLNQACVVPYALQVRQIVGAIFRRPEGMGQ